jgi:hypothetical protein
MRALRKGRIHNNLLDAIRITRKNPLAPRNNYFDGRSAIRRLTTNRPGKPSRWGVGFRTTPLGRKGVSKERRPGRYRYSGQKHCENLASRNSPSFAVALNCGMGSSSLNADVNAFDRLQIVRERNSSYFGAK